MTRKAPPSYETQSLRDFAEVIRGRRTINLYLQTPVPHEVVREAIEAATWAPNHHVTEPWHFYLLGPETVERSLDLCCEIVTAKKGSEAGEFKREKWSEKPGWLVVT
jgi:nitroreductase